MVDVGSEWRTFSNEKSTSDPSRVGAAQVGLRANDNNIIQRIVKVKEGDQLGKKWMCSELIHDIGLNTSKFDLCMSNSTKAVTGLLPST